jgi:hypothetical protein
MAIQTWTTGQTLLASQLTALNANDYNWTVNAQTASYVLVAADAGKHVTMSNAGATTITVNTSLFTAGDTLRITNIGAGTCTITAGTATVSTAGSLALTQYASGILWFQAAGVAYFFPDAKTTASGLTYLTGASFSGATTVSLPTDTFTATYQNYKIVFVISSTHVAGTILSCRLRVAGADSSANSYYGSMLGAQGGTTQYLSNNPTTSYQLLYLSATAGRVAGEINVMAPKEAVSTRFLANCIGVQAGDTVSSATVGGAFFDAATVFDSLTLISAAGNLAGNYRVYGYANA